MSEGLITIQQFKDAITRLCNQVTYGCTNGGCQMRPPGKGGQHTNASCFCRPKDFKDDLFYLALELEKHGRRQWPYEKPADQYLIVEARVRRSENSKINGNYDDEDFPKMPFLNEKLWKININLETGVIKDWPIGTTAQIHYKVCDGGEYFIGKENGEKMLKYSDYYVPKCLCIGEAWCGDYMIFTISEGGQILDWKKPDVKEDWETV